MGILLYHISVLATKSISMECCSRPVMAVMNWYYDTAMNYHCVLVQRWYVRTANDIAALFTEPHHCYCSASTLPRIFIVSLDEALFLSLSIILSCIQPPQIASVHNVLFCPRTLNKQQIPDSQTKRASLFDVYSFPACRAQSAVQVESEAL